MLKDLGEIQLLNCKMRGRKMKKNMRTIRIN